MRNQKQRSQRLSRIKLANELLELLKGRDQWEGNDALSGIVEPFAEKSGVAIFEVWKAWDILMEAGRRRPLPGSYWALSAPSWSLPIEANENGDILPVSV